MVAPCPLSKKKSKKGEERARGEGEVGVVILIDLVVGAGWLRLHVYWAWGCTLPFILEKGQKGPFLEEKGKKGQMGSKKGQPKPF